MATTATTTPSATSLTTLHRRIPLFPTTTTLLSLSSSSKPLFLSLSSTRSFPTHLYCIKKDDIDITFFEQDNPDEEITFDPPEKPEGYIPPRAVDEPPFESEEEIALAYEELYGAAYSGESLLGNDVYAMDSKIKKATGFGSKSKKEKIRDGFEENVVQVYSYSFFKKYLIFSLYELKFIPILFDFVLGNVDLVLIVVGCCCCRFN